MNTTESKLQITNIIQNFKLIGNLIGIYIISLFGLVFTNGSKENIKKEEKAKFGKNQILFILPNVYRIITYGNNCRISVELGCYHMKQ